MLNTFIFGLASVGTAVYVPNIFKNQGSNSEDIRVEYRFVLPRGMTFENFQRLLPTFLKVDLTSEYYSKMIKLGILKDCKIFHSNENCKYVLTFKSKRDLNIFYNDGTQLELLNLKSVADLQISYSKVVI